jgi:alkylation response protein AidB-like acyl-CoA dehydrogenase
VRNDERWCQLFSEPGAGSDLASLAMRAERDGDEWVLTGQKVWTTWAHMSEFGICLARTEPNVPKRQGITYFLVDLRAPGVEVRELRHIGGEVDFNEVFLDAVRVPDFYRVGAINDGWRVANVTLSFERGTGFVGELLETSRTLADLVRIAQEVPRGERTAWEDDRLRHELGVVAIELDALWAFTKRNVSQGAKGALPMGGGSAFKLALAGSVSRLGDVALRIIDRAALSLDGGESGAGPAAQVQGKLRAFAISTGGGTSQIQQNIIAERVLGLPRER